MTHRSRRVLAAASAFAIAAAPVVLRGQKNPSVEDLLKSAGDYLTQYSQKLGAVAAEEEYMQYETSSGQMGVPKRVISDVIWIGTGGAIEGFRDVVAIDRVATRPKDDRLLALFKTPSAAALTQARQMTEDAVHQYLDPNLHALDQPMMALQYLLPANQGRSTFKVENVKNSNGAPVATVKFTEKGSERLVPSFENGAAVGRFWIDTASGTVRQTELGFGGRNSNIHVTVKFALDPGSGLWLPAELSQQSSVSGGSSSAGSNMGAGGGYSGHQSAEGRATYSKFRQLPLDASKLR
jgi:hypothetical protein